MLSSNRTVTVDNLRAQFARFGAIADARVEALKKGRSRGHGFVTFSSVDVASKAQVRATNLQNLFLNIFFFPPLTLHFGLCL
jgi:hypothetical protein